MAISRSRAVSARATPVPPAARLPRVSPGFGIRASAKGLLLVGLDVIGQYLTEVNVTSPTCFQEIMQQTGFDVAGMMIDAVERYPGAPAA